MISWLSKKFSSPGKSRSRRASKDEKSDKITAESAKLNTSFSTKESGNKLLESFRRQSTTKPSVTVTNTNNNGKKGDDSAGGRKYGDESTSIRSRSPESSFTPANSTPNQSRCGTPTATGGSQVHTPNSASHKLGSIYFKKPVEIGARAARRGSSASDVRGFVENESTNNSNNNSMISESVNDSDQFTESIKEFNADLQSDASSINNNNNNNRSSPSPKVSGPDHVRSAIETNKYQDVYAKIASGTEADVSTSVSKPQQQPLFVPSAPLAQIKEMGVSTESETQSTFSGSQDEEKEEKGEKGEKEEKEEEEEETGYNSRSIESVRITSNPLNGKGYTLSSASSGSSSISGNGNDKAYGENDIIKKTSRNALLGQYV